MCGICGILGFSDGFAVDEETVVRMRDTLEHRGPDDADAVHLPAHRVALGHRRLSIVDLSPSGRQPMANEDGSVWLVFNGEIYNHEALRAELERKGHRYRSHTDSESIIHLYEEEGPRCVERLHGMFAFAIYDGRRRELFLARDRVGVKPLYYAQLPGGLLFGSEIKALLEHPAVERDIDEHAFYDYLTFAFTPPPRTMYRGISKLAPAERLLVRADGTSHREIYWSPLTRAAELTRGHRSEREMTDTVRDLLRESIRKRMMSDVPFGVFLSGGLDSSTNVALMAELVDQPVRTFSTAPREHAKYDELSYARLVADRFGTDHHEIVIDSSDMEDFLPSLVFHQDEPLSDWTAVPQHFVSKLARDNGTIVVQCGEGSDELFHGYNGYAAHRRYVQPFQRLPRPMRVGMARLATHLTRRLGKGIRHGEALYDAATSPLPYWGGALCFRGELKRDVVGETPYPDSYTTIERIWGEAQETWPGVDLFGLMTYVELKQRLSELLLMRLDRMTMANSIEGREPFLDHELVELALSLPPRMKYRNGVGKHVLREAVRGIVPDPIIDRPKQGFGTPVEEWLREDFGVRAQQEVRRSSLIRRGLLDGEKVDRLFEAHRAGRGNWAWHLWNVYSVAIWHDHWVAGELLV